MKKLKSQAGQLFVESILLMIVFISIGTLTVRYFRREQFMAQLVSGPWEHVAGMIENGIWRPRSESKPQHPNFLYRHSAPRGDNVR